MGRGKQDLEREKQDHDLRELLATKAGQRFFWRTLVLCKTFGPAFELDGRAHAYNEGMRAVGCKLMAEAQRVAPSSYLEMTRDRINADVAELAAKSGDDTPKTESSPD